MAKLVDQEKLAKLAKALDTRSKAAVEAEKTRATGVEAELDGKITAEKTRAEAAEKAVKDAVDKLNGTDTIVGSVDNKIKLALTPVKADLDAAEEKIAANTSAIGAANTAIATGDAQTLATAKTYADTQISALVNGAPEAMNTLKELADSIAEHQDAYDAYVAKVTQDLDGKVDKVAGSRLMTEAEATKFNAKAEVSQVNQALTDAKGYTDAEIGKVNTSNGNLGGRVTSLETTVGKAAENENPATGLVKDVADIKAKNTQQDGAISAAQGAADAANGEIASLKPKVGTLETTVGNSGSGLVKDVADIKAKNTQQDGTISAAQADATKALADAAAAKGVADGAASEAAKNKTAIATLQGTVGNAESGLVKDVAGNKAAIAAINNGTTGILAQAKAYTNSEVGKVRSDLTTLSGTVDGHTTQIDNNTAAIGAEVSRAKAAEGAIDAKITTLNGGVSVTGSVDKKISDALSVYSDTDQVKSILSSVVQSLSLGIAENKISLKLGGVQGVTLTETTLDLVTDKDIDDMIAALDAEA